MINFKHTDGPGTRGKSVLISVLLYRKFKTNLTKFDRNESMTLSV